MKTGLLLRFKAPGPWPTRELRECVQASDYDALRTAASAYLEALRVAVQHMEDATENGYDRRVMLDALEYIGEVPEETI